MHVALPFCSRKAEERRRRRAKEEADDEVDRARDAQLYPERRDDTYSGEY